MLQQDIFETILAAPYENGLRDLRIFSGFASSGMTYYVLNEAPFAGLLRLELTIGMAPHGLIRIWDHLEFQRQQSELFACRYYLERTPSHSKIYVWFDSDGKPARAFVGSPNFSWNGFRDFKETIIEANPEQAHSLFPIPESVIKCDAPDVDQRIKFSYQREKVPSPLIKPMSKEPSVDTDSIEPLLVGKDSVTLSLLTGNGEMPQRSGLNWGQRPGRDHDQAYIQIPTRVHHEHPDFFPPPRQEFTLVTDDGQQFLCVIAQDNDKAIESKRDNGELGRYIRDRINVPRGEFVTKEQLIAYGRTDVTITRLDGDAFYLNFASGQAP